MSTLLEQASLVMIPSGYKEDVVYSQIPTSGAGDLSFTRASNGTRVNSAGLVEVCPWNLLEYSEQFTNGVWAIKNGTFTDNFATAPNGTQTACKWVATDSDPYIYQSFNGANVTYTATCWIKATGTAIGKNCSIRFGGTVALSVMTGEWQQLTLSANINGSINVGVEAPESATSGEIVYIWGFQLNLGNTAKPYFPTTDRLNVPRLTYQNGGGGCPSLLLEKQSTNLMYPSEDFSSGNYIKAECSVTTNQTISPDGTQNADAYISTTNNVPHPLIYLSTQSGTITYSLFVKKSYSRYVSLKNTGGPTNWGAAIYDLDSIVVTKTDSQGHTIVGTSIVDMGNGWRRITLTTTGNCTDFSVQYTPNGTATFSSYGDIIATGTNQVDYYIYGGQLEASSYPTSYIPTTSSSATRVADVCVKSSISSLIGQTEGVAFVDFDFNGNYSGGGVIPLCLDGGGGNELYIWVQTSGVLLCEVANSGSVQASITGAIGALGRKKIAFAYKQNDFVVYLNGTQFGTDTSGTVPTMSRLYVGKYYANNTYDLNAGINQAVLFPTRLTNAELASLTTI